MSFIELLFLLCERTKKPQASGKVVNFEAFTIMYLPLQCPACIFHLLIFLGKCSWFIKQTSPEVWLLLLQCLCSLGVAHLGTALPHSRFKPKETLATCPGIPQPARVQCPGAWQAKLSGLVPPEQSCLWGDGTLWMLQAQSDLPGQSASRTLPSGFKAQLRQSLGKKWKVKTGH